MTYGLTTFLVGAAALLGACNVDRVSGTPEDAGASGAEATAGAGGSAASGTG